MGRIAEPFAPVTRTIAEALNSAPPAAYKLWVHLRQENRPERAFNFDLAEAASALGYTVRWVREALLKLKDLEVIEVLEQWWGHRYKLRLPDIESGGLESGNKSGDRQRENSQTEGSNPDDSVPLDQRSFKRDHVASGVENRESHGEVPPTEPEPTERLYEEVKEVAPNFNPKVFLECLARFGEGRIRAAIGAVREQIRRGNTKNAAASLHTAIHKGYTFQGGGLKESERVPIAVSPGHDLTDLLFEISMQIRQLRWGRETIRGLLLERYGARSQHELSDANLKDWLSYLNSSATDNIYSGDASGA